MSNALVRRITSSRGLRLLRVSAPWVLRLPMRGGSCTSSQANSKAHSWIRQMGRLSGKGVTSFHSFNTFQRGGVTLQLSHQTSPPSVCKRRWLTLPRQARSRLFALPTMGVFSPILSVSAGADVSDGWRVSEFIFFNTLCLFVMLSLRMYCNKSSHRTASTWRAAFLHRLHNNWQPDLISLELDCEPEQVCTKHVTAIQTL